MPSRRSIDPERRRRALQAGRGGEWVAIAYLRCKGYRILARRFLVKGGEIDIVAQRGTTIAFVEVKLRAALDDARLSIHYQKRLRLARAARAFISRYRIVGATLRGDAIFLAPWRWPIHVPAAFELTLD